MGEEQKLRERLMLLDQEYNQIKVHIESLVGERTFDQLLVQRLKRRKLQLKDEILYLRKFSCDDIIA